MHLRLFGNLSLRFKIHITTHYARKESKIFDIIPINEYNINCNKLCGLIKREEYMEYLTTVELSEKWGISSRRISVLCAERRIEGAVKKGKTWLIPSDSQKPNDARIRTGRYIKHDPDKIENGMNNNEWM